ncbi:hypothetical protein GGH19_001544 [Coemansia sp. RSA 1807]|nr:hypothetical protein GGH15_003939 [Coemansia sp. RSA 562]KAJ2226482.1 hypothetical protein EV180_002917 [Coemansia sp. RSA 518]KAJ2275138.1 hypothetical protein GGH14_003904 [Coemansia sp. RSA 370]KAJ2577204.1 hypothetical protein GGH19_001544 [Coemansia sp. RSA 1807]
MPPRFKELYKPRPTNSDVRHRRLLHESQLRQLQREQLFMGKRLRLRTPQESETESEYEFTPSTISALVAGLQSTERDERVAALANLSTRLEQPSHELRAYVESGSCMDVISKVLAASDAEATLQALWCLTNIAGGEPRMAERALEAAPAVVSLAESQSVDLQNQAIWALGNMAAEGECARNQLYANGAVDAIVNVVKSTQDSGVLQTACFALSNLARKPSSFFANLFDLCVPQAVAQQLREFESDAECVAELAWVCVYLSASSSEAQIDALLASGAVGLLVEFAAKSSVGSATLIPIIRTLGNVAAGTDAQTHALASNAQFVTLLVRSIESTSSRAVEKEALWVLSSVTAGTADDVDIMVRAGVVSDLARIVGTQNFDIRKEAARSLLNIAIVGHRTQDLPNRELAPHFVDFVACQDEELVRMGVQFVALLFEHLPNRQGQKILSQIVGAIDVLENLVAVTSDDETRSLVSALIDDYYADLSL